MVGLVDDQHCRLTEQRSNSVIVTKREDVDVFVEVVLKEKFARKFGSPLCDQRLGNEHQDREVFDASARAAE